ncbi:MAG: Fe-S cluster assembly protein SufB [Rickettsiales bacterium]|jgi:Fe-S cluster assembly protein SufB|nr:Fe-S cluster assembly protein SufB [Rickettsiales bacterium]
MLNEQTILNISRLRGEPEWLTDWRLRAFAAWKKMTEPHWAEIDYDPIDYDAIDYYKKSAPVDNSDLRETYEKMGLPIAEQNALLGIATDTVIDSVSVHTSYTDELKKLGIIFLPFSDAVKQYPDLIKKYLGSVVPMADNFFACLNAAVFSDGTFVYVPKNTKCPIDLASYFRIETAKIGQFERTLIIADTGAELSYMEGCSAPRRTGHQLHSGVVEVVAHDNATVKYATVQNWDKDSIYNFVTKRATAYKNARVLWTQVEIGASKTWKYPGTILLGDNASSDFYSLTITRGTQMADTGTRMIHIGDNTSSAIVSYGVAMENSRQTFRSTVSFGPDTSDAKNSTKCDTKIMGDSATANTLPRTVLNNGKNLFSHEARTGSIPADALNYLAAFGIESDTAAALIVSGAATNILRRLPMEFLVESKQLIQLAMEKM